MSRRPIAMSASSIHSRRAFHRRRNASSGWRAIISWLLSGMMHLSLVILAWISLVQSRPPQDVEITSVVGMLDVEFSASAARGQGTDGIAPGETGEEGTPGDGLPSLNSTTADQLLAESFSAPPTMYASSASANLPVLGGGPPELSGGAGGTLLNPSGGRSGSGGSGISGVGDGGGGAGGNGGGGGTSLFGVSDAGRRFVYVLDNSGSMQAFQAMQAAKNELTRSVESLDSEQQFLVIFYNVELTIIAPRAEQLRMFQGTDADRLELGQQIAPITGDGGTDHVLALREALKYHADVIFFLTDAGRPGLSTAEIEDITTRNGGASRIHCIEFGENPDFAEKDPSNSLRRLADLNNGRYTYKDVRTFR